ncbi:MAG: hypothetical protein IPQ07_23645 [Myxococcales bacterium]|nr:hypothetical protein [Myxococcales bacterium]
MSEVSVAVERAWRDGVGPDDLAALRALMPQLATAPLADDPATPTLRLFAALLELTNNVRVEVPDAGGSTALDVVHAAARVLQSRLSRQPGLLDDAMDALGHSLSRLVAGDPHGLAARAWADYALAEVAIAVGDAGTTRRRLEAVAQPGAPIALRIQAMLRLAAATSTRLELGPARAPTRKAVVLAETAKRTQHARRARMACALLDLMAGDVRSMRTTLGPAIAAGDPFARVLLAGAENASNAMELLAAGIREATEQGDPFAYMVCILVGARRYAQIGRDADALITITAGIANLEPVASDLATILRDERTTWQTSWREGRYAEAEQKAANSLDAI